MYDKKKKMQDLNRVFNKLVIIEKREMITDEIGQQFEKWTEVHKFYAEVNNLYGNEYYSAKSMNEEKTLVFKCRYSRFFDSINTIDYRAVFNDTVLDIRQIDNMMYENNTIKIRALERGQNGD